MANPKKNDPSSWDLDDLVASSDELLDEFPYAVAMPNDETPTDVDATCVGVEISMYLGWAIDAQLTSDGLAKNCKKQLELFRARKLGSRQILRDCCGDTLEVSHLNDVGNAFTRCYLRPGWDYFYLEDLGNLFPKLSDFAYLTENWENFDLVSAMISTRFKAWRGNSTS